MKMKKLISTALVFVMIVTSMLVAIPFSASAAEEKTEISILQGDKVITDGDKVKEICESYLTYNFKTASDMLAYEMELGYLDYIKKGNFAVYVNRYTGFMYYVNEVTGQILTSNPIDPAYQTKEGGTIVSLDKKIMGQMIIEYFNLSSTTPLEYDSLKWIMDGSLLNLYEYEDGIAVEYTLGSAVDSFISPYTILFDKANEMLFLPAFEKLENLLLEKCGPYDTDIADRVGLVNVTSDSYKILDNKKVYFPGLEIYSTGGINRLLEDYRSYADECLGGEKNSDFVQISNYIDAIKTLFTHYDMIDPSLANDLLVEKIAALSNNKAVILLDGADTGDVTITISRQVEKAIKLIAPEFTKEMAKECVEETGFSAGSLSVPAFKITMVYSLDGGDLIVSIPANLISIVNPEYAIKSITPLKYFGAGDMDEDGYVFYPDGSGAILNFDDFYYGSESEEANTTVYIESPVFGADYCYSTITGAHREQIVMPVYGMSSDVNAGNIGLSAGRTDVRNGYFAIMEEGASLVTLGCESGGGMHKYISVFTEFAPFPTDTYNLSQSISVSGLGYYTVVAKAQYTESYTTRFVMLEDEEFVEKGQLLDPSYDGFESSYVGMASCYRKYLEDSGAIELLKESYSDLPLYIEALGSIDITKKFLSFPVTVSTPLTTFDDVERMYSELSNAKATLKEKAAQLNKEADELEKENIGANIPVINRNRALAEEYLALAEKISDLNNINFRLTGFTNGGMHSTYPAKIKWEKSVGGSKGFKELLSTAKSESGKDGYTFGIYPEFDFMYLSSVAPFDGVSNKIASCKVDNRYASKQSYNSINQEFESMFALVVSSGSLDELYTKFDEKYSGYDVGGISVSTLGSDLNSNFDVDNPIIRESGIDNIKSLLGRMSADYKVMADKGNMYTVQYLDHILNAPLDSSHLNNSSFAVPFYGMVLHGYVNYTGTPINYSGSPEYDILRAIESGASLYYILCTKNTNYLKEDFLLSKYYGVDYENWFTKIVEQSSVIDEAIGDLQLHKIVNHSTLLSERVLNADDTYANNLRLVEEFISKLDSTISAKIDKAIKDMRDDDNNIGKGLKFSVSSESVDEILANAADRINVSVEQLCRDYELDHLVSHVIDKYEIQYSQGSVEVTVNADEINYKSKYKYVTDSNATDENYVKTDFTCDNGNVVTVTYEREINGEKETVVFLLNYNVFSVKIRIDETLHPNYLEYCDKDGYIILDSFGYARIEG